MGLCGTDRGEKNNLAVCVFVINIKLLHCHAVLDLTLFATTTMTAMGKMLVRDAVHSSDRVQASSHPELVFASQDSICSL